MSINALVMKAINTDVVRRMLKSMQVATKHQVAQATGLSVVTVGNILQGLLDANEVLDAGPIASSGGRRAQSFRFNENFAHVLVLFSHEQDGADMLHVRVANLYGSSVYEHDAPLDNIALHTFEPYVETALAEFPTIAVIGFGLPGVEMDGNIVLGDYPMLTNTAFVNHYQARYQRPVIIENDVNAAVVGYCKHHQLSSETTTMYLYFPQKYPPGGGISINGDLYKGRGNYAGEIAGIPLGIDWNDAALYTDIDHCCAAITKLIVAICMMLNPHNVVLFGNFLSAQHLQTIQQQCQARLPEHALASILLATHFTLDYENGLIAETLDLIEPSVPLTQ